MFRTSTFMAMALSATAIATATTPAAAFSSQFLGGAGNHLVSQFHPAPAVTSIQSSLQAHRVLTPVSPPQKIIPPGSVSIGKSEMPIPAGERTSIGSIREPLPKYPAGPGSTLTPSELGKLAARQLPPPQYKPGNGVDNICPFNPLKCAPAGSNGGSNGGQTGSNSGKDSGGGPVVILAPQLPVQTSVQVPVAVPVPVTVPVRVATAAGSVAAPAKPAVTGQCGGNIPALAAGVDELLPQAQLSEADMTKVTELRQMIQDLATTGNVDAARNAEEVAMYYLGYQKIWLKCGLGTFAWTQIAYNDAGKSSAQSK